ncbi:hypothetical protein, partial [Desulfosporosinus nitroreducens]|uniref:hypothetical protein n=1 Tax=Desulfosporosinus nitroreducens TaxID=2018668 RepID=UPI00207CAE7C
MTYTQKNYLVRDSFSLVYLAMTYFPRSYAPSILGPGTKGTIVSCGQYRRATRPKETLRGEG